jgi:hypothetical protein
MITTDSRQICTNECHSIGQLDAEHTNEMIFAKWHLTDVDIKEDVFRKYGHTCDIETLKNTILNQYIFFHVSKNRGKVEWRQIEFYVNDFIDNIVGCPLDKNLGNPFHTLTSQLRFYKASEINSDIFPCPESLCKDYHSVITVYSHMNPDLGS